MTNEASKTPRTTGATLYWNLSDREMSESIKERRLGYYGENLNGKLVPADFARQLETELIALRENFNAVVAAANPIKQIIESRMDLDEMREERDQAIAQRDALLKALRPFSQIRLDPKARGEVQVFVNVEDVYLAYECRVAIESTTAKNDV